MVMVLYESNELSVISVQILSGSLLMFDKILFWCWIGRITGQLMLILYKGKLMYMYEISGLVGSECN